MHFMTLPLTFELDLNLDLPKMYLITSNLDFGLNLSKMHLVIFDLDLDLSKIID